MTKQFYFSFYLTLKPKVKLLNYKCDYVNLEYGTLNQLYPIGKKEDLWYIKTEEGSLSSINDCLLVLKELTFENLMAVKNEIANAFGIPISNDNAFWGVNSADGRMIMSIIEDIKKGKMELKWLIEICKLGFDCFDLIKKGYAIKYE